MSYFRRLIKLGENYSYNWLSHFWKRINLNIWLMIFVVIGLISFTAWILWSARVRTMAEQYNATQLVTAKAAAQGIEEFIIPLMHELDHLSGLPSVRYMEDLERLDKSLKISHRRFRYQILGYARINENGVVIHTYPYNKHLQNQNLSKMEYIQQVNTTHKRAISHPFLTPDRERVVALADPIRSKDGKYLGIIQSWVSLESLRQLFLSKIMIDTNAWVFIYDMDGYLVDGPVEHLIGQHYSQYIDSVNQSSMLDLITRMINGEQGTIVHSISPPNTQKKDIPQEKMLTAFVPIRFLLKDQWWSIGLVTPYRTAVALSRNFLQDEIVLIVLTAILLIVVGAFLFAREKKVLKAMEESEEKFRNLAEQSPNMICINIGRQVVYVNKKCEEVVGYKKEEFYSPDFDFFTLIGSESVNKVKASYNMHLKGEEVSTYEFSLITKEGKRIDAIATTKLINYEGDSAVLGIVTDITEHKKAEEELKRAYKELKASQLQLIQSEKLAALGQLATGVAHEINNPLFVISAEAEMLWKDEDEDMNTKDASKVILEQAERINVITEGLLGFSRKRELKKDPLDVNDVLEKSTSLLDYQAKIEDIEIIKDLDPNLPKVHGDSSELQKTFLNIMLNAVQVMEKGGKLTVRTRKEKITKNERRKKDKFKLGEELVVVEFEDKGKGMDEETLAKIFDPFFSTKETGVGLGLSICHRIIENHRGVIEAHSKLGEGSTFIVKLPILRGGQ